MDRLTSTAKATNAFAWGAPIRDIQARPACFRLPALCSCRGASSGTRLATVSMASVVQVSELRGPEEIVVVQRGDHVVPLGSCCRSPLGGAGSIKRRGNDPDDFLDREEFSSRVGQELQHGASGARRDRTASGRVVALACGLGAAFALALWALHGSLRYVAGGCELATGTQCGDRRELSPRAVGSPRSGAHRAVERPRPQPCLGVRIRASRGGDVCRIGRADPVLEVGCATTPRPCSSSPSSRPLSEEVARINERRAPSPRRCRRCGSPRAAFIESKQRSRSARAHVCRGSLVGTIMVLH